MTEVLLGVLIILVLVLLAAILFALLRRPQMMAGGIDVATPLQNLTQAVEQSRRETAVLAEKMARLEPVAAAVGGLQGELRAAGERISSVEGSISRAGSALADVRNDMTRAGTNTEGLLGVTRQIQEQLAGAQNNLSELKAQAQAQGDLERRNADALRRLEAVIAGTHTKGVAGENILEAVFSKLPTEWQVRGFTVQGKTCEFGLRLPNNLVLPIDSKWAATNLVEQFCACDDGAEKERLKSQIEGAVLAKAREVKKYLDPDYTLNFGVAVVPDAVYELCGGTLCDSLTLNIAVVSYSMFIPYLLLVFHTVLKTTQNIDMEKLERALADAETSVKEMQDELEGRYSRALTMLDNSRRDMKEHVAKVGSRISGLRLNNVPPAEPLELPLPPIIQ
jgi:DNA recombination protein RmuC